MDGQKVLCVLIDCVTIGIVTEAALNFQGVPTLGLTYLKYWGTSQNFP